MDFLKNIDFGELLGKMKDLFGKIDWGDLWGKIKPALGKVADFLKKTPSMFVAFTVFLTVLADPVAGNTGSARLVHEEVRTLIDASFMSKGLTNDGAYYYTSGAVSFAKYTALAKYEIGTLKRVKYKVFPVNWDLIKKGYDNIGGISWYNGKLYAAMESKSGKAAPCIAVFSADSLAYETRYELPACWFPQGITWVAVDRATGLLYTGAWPTADSVHVFRIDATMAHVRQIDVSGLSSLDRICGGEVYGGVLYLSQDVESERINNVLRVNVQTGESAVYFTRDSGRAEAPAGDVTVFPKADGSLFHVADYNGILGVYLRSYAVI
ncbi:MAG: hypothetical protein IJT44_07000 [Clostridia bacterium]|nr:hypothetical protein [Clostridia bacterium]